MVVAERPTYLAPSRSPLAATSLSLDVPRGEALPFAKGASEAPSPPPALPRVNRPPPQLSGTSLALDLPIGPALPFAKSADDTLPVPPPKPLSPSSAGDEPPPPPSTLPRVHKAPAHLSGTMRALDLPVAPALPFAKNAPGEPPALTLEEYAALRANLTVKGEEDPGTWKQFGIASHAMKEALQARFAARFRDDAEARDRFVALLQRMVSDLRAQAPST